VGYWGILQPLADAVKRFVKEQAYVLRSNYLVYYYSPSLNIVLSLGCWLIFPYIYFTFSFEYSLIFITLPTTFQCSTEPKP
jgi:NADH:ubiquinone oxidoreductase subunit H